MEGEVYAAIIGAGVALLSMFVGSTLNRKQRTREELYAYKVKAYAKLAELFSQVKQDFSVLAFLDTGSDVVPFEESRSPIQIDEYFRRNVFENYLFFTHETKLRIEQFADKITDSSRITFNHAIMPDLVKPDDLRKNYEEIINNCNEEIDKLYYEIGLHKIK